MSYESVILDEQQHGGLPFCYYSLDEATGIVANDLMVRAKGSGNNGTYVASPALNAQPGPINRERAGWITLNGSTQYVNCGTLGNLGSLIGNGVSVEMWVAISNAVTAIVGFAGNYVSYAYANLLLRLNVKESTGANVVDSIGFFLTDSTGTPLKRITAQAETPNPTIRDGLPHHVVWTETGSTVAIYVDSVAQSVTYGLQNTLGLFYNYIANWYLGAWNNNGALTQPFPGQIGRVAIYNYALAPARVTAHYLAGRNGAAKLLDLV